MRPGPRRPLRSRPLLTRSVSTLMSVGLLVAAVQVTADGASAAVSAAQAGPSSSAHHAATGQHGAVSHHGASAHHHEGATVLSTSFAQGARQWRKIGEATELRTRGAGQGSYLQVTARRSHAGLRTVRPAAPLVNPAHRISATLRVRSASAARVTVVVRAARHRSKRRVAALQVTLARREWRKVTVSRAVHIPAGARLSVAVIGSTKGGPVHVDMDALSLRVGSQRTGHSGTWESGASGDGVADGSFGAWRGSPVTIAGTWNDGLEAQINEWTLLPQFEYGNWNRDLDVAVGAIYKPLGESWAAAAQGAYDARWRAALTTMAAARAGHSGTMYIRFAHEFNGDWEPWSVSSGEVADFKAAWARFHALQQQILPSAKMVFCPSAETSSSLHLDWRTAFPGRNQVDVMGVDFYNQWPYVNDASSFQKNLTAQDAMGAPRGLEAHRLFAQKVGLPFAIPEWSTNASMGDADVFMHQFHDWVASHAGTGAGQVLYEILFNVGGFGTGQFQVFPQTEMTRAAQAYAAEW